MNEAPNWSEHEGEILPPTSEPVIPTKQPYLNRAEMAADPEFAAYPKPVPAEVNPVDSVSKDVNDLFSAQAAKEAAERVLSSPRNSAPLPDNTRHATMRYIQGREDVLGK